MKKIGILTINDFDNYGNRLQNYALQEFLKESNYDVETIKNVEFINKNRNFVYKLIKCILYRGTYSKVLERKMCFKEFNENIKFSKKIIFPKSRLKYDYVFVGSDQVWNPQLGRLSYIDLLTSVEPSKRVAFAASFGINELPEEVKANTAEQLKKFKAISVREDRGKQIVEELTNRKDIEVLIDPTMLLTQEKWEKVLKKPKRLENQKYILCYFLGEISEERKNKINRISNENNLEIINVLDKKSPFYAIGPSEFLYLEKNASFICTDSFHACVFAIIFEKKFCVFDREDKTHKQMNSRIDTLLNKFGLNYCKYSGNLNECYLKRDYSKIEDILIKEKNKCKKFIENL